MAYTCFGSYWSFCLQKIQEINLEFHCRIARIFGGSLRVIKFYEGLTGFKPPGNA